MIFGNLHNLESYKNQLPEGIYESLKKMREFDFENAADGKFEIADAGMMSLESPMTEPVEARRLEGHRKFIDVVLLVDGEEWIGVLPITDARGVTEEIPDRDLYFYEGTAEETRVHMRPGRFLICFPDDLHRPLCATADGPAKIRKAVLKYPVTK